MTEQVFAVPERFIGKAWLNKSAYQALYQRSISEPDSFWAEQAHKNLSWDRAWSKVSDCNFHEAQVAWFVGAKLNVSFNCLDRHLRDRQNKTAIIWEGNDPSEVRKLTYKESLCKCTKS